MAGLQVLEEEFSSQGFHLLGFFSNDFGNQGGDGDDIDACNEEHQVAFQEFDIDHVIDPDADGPEVPQPAWSWILSQPSPGPEQPLAPTWNFHKYLISRSGQLVAHYAQGSYWGTDPGSPTFDTSEVVVGIRNEIAQPAP